MLNPAPRTIYLKDYTPPAFLISTIDLDVDLLEDCARVRAAMSVRRNPASADRSAPLVLDGDELELESIRLNGQPLTADHYALDDSRLTLPHTPDEFTLETSAIIRPRENTKLMGLY